MYVADSDVPYMYNFVLLVPLLELLYIVLLHILKLELKKKIKSCSVLENCYFLTLLDKKINYSLLSCDCHKVTALNEWRQFFPVRFLVYSPHKKMKWTFLECKVKKNLVKDEKFCPFVIYFVPICHLLAPLTSINVREMHLGNIVELSMFCNVAGFVK